ncbi:MAG: hypothetical protein DRI92_02375, partial [Aquificota bacterium]
MAVKDELGDLFVESRGFGAKALTEEELEKLRELSRLCKGDILKMTSLAGSGHPGGSLSSL